jgi:hypothetical protein
MNIENKVNPNKLIVEIMKEPSLSEDTKYFLAGMVLAKKIENEMTPYFDKLERKIDNYLEKAFSN